MNRSLHYRSLWSLDALTRGDLQALLDRARALKTASRARTSSRPLRGKNLALLNDAGGRGDASALEHAAAELGAQVSQLPVAHRAPGEARLLGRLYDAIDCDGIDADTLQRIDRDAGVPVFNGLASGTHPTRVLATLLDLRERSGRPLNELCVAFIGDPRTPQGDALLQAAALAGMQLRIAAPPGTSPAAQRLQRAEHSASDSGARIVLCASAAEAAEGADFVLDASTSPLAASDDGQRFTLQALLLSTLA
jgi:ornithine carbamoyltransferase